MQTQRLLWSVWFSESSFLMYIQLLMFDVILLQPLQPIFSDRREQNRRVLSWVGEKRRVNTFILLEGNEPDRESALIHYEIHICLEIKHSNFCLHAHMAEELMPKEILFLLKWFISKPKKSINVRILKTASSKVKREKKTSSQAKIYILDASVQRCQVLRNVNVEEFLLRGGARPSLNGNGGSGACEGSEPLWPPRLICPWFLLSNTTGSSSGRPQNKGSPRPPSHCQPALQRDDNIPHLDAQINT